MAIEFAGSRGPTLGIEIELQLIDPDTRDLMSQSIGLLERCRKQGVEGVKAEITQSMV
ncbi:MAG: glutamate--cysteine ligase, partial [Deltaproteobacteria bacterium]|nr:glutamate--cysteine ligase [Deltaproteobacteria bacterium]